MQRFTVDCWGLKFAVEWEDPSHDVGMRSLLLPIWTDNPEIVPNAIFRLAGTNPDEWQVEGPDDEDSHAVDKQSAVETLERRLHTYLGSQTREVVFVHAGAVRWRDRAIVLPGRSYAGKSTLVKALVERGAGFLSDEYAVIDHRGFVHPFPRPMSLRGTEGIQRVAASHLGWEGRTQPIPASAVVLSSYSADETWSPIPITPAQTVLELMSNTVGVRAVPQLALTSLSNLARGTVNWSSPRGEAEATAAILLQALDYAKVGE